MSYRIIRLRKCFNLDKSLNTQSAQTIWNENKEILQFYTSQEVDQLKNYYEKNSPAIERPFTVQEVKKFMKIKDNIEDSGEDKLLDLLIVMATEYAEWYIGCSIIRKIWEVTYQGKFPNIVELPYGPVKSIQAVYLDDYLLEKAAHYKEEEEKYLFFKKPIAGRRLKVIYSAGYSQSELPEAIRLGILHHVASAYYKGYLPSYTRQNEIETVTFMHTSDVLETMSLLKQLYNPYRKLEIAL